MTEFSSGGLKPLVTGLDALARGTFCGLLCLMLSFGLDHLDPGNDWVSLLVVGALASFVWAAAGPCVCLLSPFLTRYRVAMALALLAMGAGFGLTLAPGRLDLGEVAGLSILFSVGCWFYSLWGLAQELHVPRARRPLLGSLLLMLPVPLLAGATAAGIGPEWMFLAWSVLLLALVVHWLALFGLSQAARRKMAELQSREPESLGLSRASE